MKMGESLFGFDIKREGLSFFQVNPDKVVSGWQVTNRAALPVDCVL